MSVAVSCNLSDGVVLGVDSATTLLAPEGVVKVFENTEKLFQLGARPIGIATFGIGAFGARSIGSYVREFETVNPNDIVAEQNELKDVVEELRRFFMDVYDENIIRPFEKQKGQKFDSVPLTQQPGFGLVVGGFSVNQWLSEIWTVYLPRHATVGSAENTRKRGEFGTNWYASFNPIGRYIKGFDPQLLDEIGAYFEKLLGRELADVEKQEIVELVNKHEYPIPFAGMPMEEGVAHTRFLVELVINHHRYVAGAPIVGGKARIGKVTYKGEKFQILDG